MARIKLDGIHKEWGGVVGVSDFNLEIADNEFIVLLGPSGCGKTTTMRMIAGLESPTSGGIYFDDRLINRLEPKDRDVAMVFQGYGLYPNLSVYENVRFPLRVRKTEKSQQRDRVLKAARRVELDRLLERKPKELSGGQRQRVALARAIVREPKVFLMDEPLSNLDAKLRVSTRAEIKHLQNELEITTIYVTHDQIEAMTLASRVVVMNHGVIQQVATPSEIYNKPANLFVAGFIGSPPMNVIEGEFADGNFTARGVSVPGIGIDHRGKAFLGFRPEDAVIKQPDEPLPPDCGEVKSDIYSFELLGDATAVTVKIGEHLVVVKMGKDFLARIGENVTLSIPASKCSLFEADEPGRRIN